MYAPRENALGLALLFFLVSISFLLFSALYCTSAGPVQVQRCNNFSAAPWPGHPPLATKKKYGCLRWGLSTEIICPKLQASSMGMKSYLLPVERLRGLGIGFDHDIFKAAAVATTVATVRAIGTAFTVSRLVALCTRKHGMDAHCLMTS